MSDITFKIRKIGDIEIVTALIDGQLFDADSSHPHYAEIVEGLRNGQDVTGKFDKMVALKQHGYRRLSERISVKGRTIYFDGDPMHSALADQLIDFLDAGEDAAPLVTFWEKLASNSLEHSRAEAYHWLGERKFAITDGGDIVAYKGMSRDDLGYYPGYNGTIMVNGISGPAQGMRQNVGDVVEMPRSEVIHNPEVFCSVGLHVGTFDFARGYCSGGAVVTVLVNPRDIVSVPTGGGKMRVCRYVIIDVASKQFGGLVLSVPEHVNDTAAYDPEAASVDFEEFVELIDPGPTPSDVLEDDEDEDELTDDEVDAWVAPIPGDEPAPKKEGIVARVKRKIVSHGTDWTPELIATLLACQTKADFEANFPGKNVETLKRRQREFRKQQG